jgi:hypothetical protein
VPVIEKIKLSFFLSFFLFLSLFPFITTVNDKSQYFKMAKSFVLKGKLFKNYVHYTDTSFVPVIEKIKLSFFLSFFLFLSFFISIYYYSIND